ncbi:E3 ubiquitin-protein ligase RNF13-like [Daphnia pulex]|uniref:E3 ubiquitin-protein ligase RNF13-like n=1 Tax=Daphnia pulex TaxID=6669 RepID=UPI001EDDFC28|nr:E3 ubiquitin-protein ligase RNF13-like [Daphnia pulex]
MSNSSPYLVNFLCKLIFLTSVWVWVVEADVLVISLDTNSTVNAFPSLPANFGKVLPFDGLIGCVVIANPQNACNTIDPPPKNSNCSDKWFVLIRRYDCNFVDKVRAAQNANYDAAIIYNVGSNLIEPMAGEDDDDIIIPAVFIGQDDGLKIQSIYQYYDGYMLLLTNELPFNLNSYLLPFAIVVAICFAIMVVFMLIKCVKERRRSRRIRLPSSSLKTIPTNKFKKGDPYDTCAICLEDYVDGDKLRILPCSHAYHTKCIDPWLTRNRRVCPVCKRRVIARGEHLSDSDSETEDESRPLLRPGTYGTSGGTFTDQTRNTGNRTHGVSNALVLDEEAIDRGHSVLVSADSIVIENEEATVSGNDQDVGQVHEIDMSSDGEAEQPQENLNADSSVYLTPESHRSRDPMNV